MLLNASHEITNSGLPDHIQERYVRYKQGNRAIVAWMTKHGPEKFKGRKTLPIKQLITLGRILCAKVQQIGSLPADVDYYFKEVIRERAYLSHHFKAHRDQNEKDEIDTVNHEHFTDSLKEIHEILLMAGKHKQNLESRALHHGDSGHACSEGSPFKAENVFNHLIADDSDTQALDKFDENLLSDTDTDTNTDATSDCSCSHYQSCPYVYEDVERSANTLDSEGDIGEVIESVMFLKAIREIADLTKSLWTQAGEKSLHFVACVAFTNVLIQGAITHIRSFQEIVDDSVTISRIRKQIQRLSSIQKDRDDLEHDHIIEMSEALERTYTAFNEKFVGTQQGDYLEPSFSPVTAINLPGSLDALIQTLFSNALSAVDTHRNSPITFQGLWILSKFESLRSMTTPDTSLEFCTCIYLIAVGQCAYAEALKQPPVVAVARVSALRIAKEAAISIRGFVNDKAIFPCHCLNTLGYRVLQMYHDLEDFTKNRCWDVLMQLPFVAGNHILEILDLCSYYGMHLFHYRQYVAAVLHTYRALNRLGALERIQILEEVCHIFAPVLYTTSIQPESGFMASWLRYTGARLKFRKGKKYHDHKDTWCMSIPAHAAAFSAGLNIHAKNSNVNLEKKFDYGALDDTIRLKRAGWIVEQDSYSILHRNFGTKHGVNSAATTSRSATSVFGVSSVSPLQKMKQRRTRSSHIVSGIEHREDDESCIKLEYVHTDCFDTDTSQERNLPTSKINLLSLFHSMTRVVSGVSDATHAGDSMRVSTSDENDGRGQMCLCFVQTILRAADRIQDVRKRSGIDAKGAVWSKNEKECIECYKNQLTKMLQDAKVCDREGGKWLWSSI